MIVARVHLYRLDQGRLANLFWLISSQHEGVFKGSLNARFAAIYLAGELFADPSSDTYPQDDLLILPFFRNRATSSSKGDLSLYLFEKGGREKREVTSGDAKLSKRSKPSWRKGIFVLSSFSEEALYTACSNLYSVHGLS